MADTLVNSLLKMQKNGIDQNVISIDIVQYKMDNEELSYYKNILQTGGSYTLKMDTREHIALGMLALTLNLSEK